MNSCLSPKISALSITLSLILCACHSADLRPGQPPELGDRVTLPSRNHLYAVNVNSFLPGMRVEAYGIPYDVAVNDRDEIIWIQPLSPSFRTPEGLRHGSTVADVLAAGGKSYKIEPGWKQYWILPSGWYAALGTESPFTADSQITSFFKRRYP